MSKLSGAVAPYSKAVAAGLAAAPSLVAQGLIPDSTIARVVDGAVGLVLAVVAVVKAPANLTAHEQAVRSALDELAALRQAAAEAEAAQHGAPRVAPGPANG